MGSQTSLKTSQTLSLDPPLTSHFCENEYGEDVRHIVFLTVPVITILSILSSWRLVRMGRMDNLYQILWIRNTNSVTKLHATGASTWRENVSRSAKGTTRLQRTLMPRLEILITCHEYYRQ